MGSQTRQGRKVVSIADRDLAWKDGATEMAAQVAGDYSAGTLRAARIGMIFGFVVGVLLTSLAGWGICHVNQEPAQADDYGASS